MKPQRVYFSLAAIILLVLVALLLVKSISLTSLFDRKVPRIVVIMKTTERISEFWLILEKGAVQAGEDLGIDVEITGPDEEDNIDQQIRILEETIRSGPDAIVLAATDYFRLIPPAAEASRQGIPLVTVDSFIDSDHSLSEIGTANFEAGRKLGAHMGELLEPGDSLAIMSFVPDSSPAIEREEGFRAALNDRFNVAETVYTNNSIDVGTREAFRLLEENPDLKGLAALNENSAVGAYRGLIQSGRTDVVFMTFDSDLELLRGLEEGAIQATVVQKPYNMGYLSVKNAWELTRGREVPRKIDTGSELITLENMYDIKNQKLLFPSH